MITLVDPTLHAPTSAPPATPKATLIAMIKENLERAEEESDQHKCLVHIKAAVSRYCGDNDTSNLEYWQRQLDLVMHQNPTLSAWAGQLPTFARIAFREIEKAASTIAPIPDYPTTKNRGRLAGRPVRQLRAF